MRQPIEEEFKPLTADRASESIEALNQVIGILDEAREEFNVLSLQASRALYRDKNPNVYRSKLEERARLLIDLRKRISKVIPYVTGDAKPEILNFVKARAIEVQKALQEVQTDESLASLMPSVQGRNWLESLIGYLKTL